MELEATFVELGLKAHFKPSDGSRAKAIEFQLPVSYILKTYLHHSRHTRVITLTYVGKSNAIATFAEVGFFGKCAHFCGCRTERSGTERPTCRSPHVDRDMRCTEVLDHSVRCVVSLFVVVRDTQRLSLMVCVSCRSPDLALCPHPALHLGAIQKIQECCPLAVSEL